MLKWIYLRHLSRDLLIRARVRIVNMLRGFEPATLIWYFVVDFFEHYGLHKDLNYVSCYEHFSITSCVLPMPAFVFAANRIRSFNHQPAPDLDRCINDDKHSWEAQVELQLAPEHIHSKYLGLSLELPAQLAFFTWLFLRPFHIIQIDAANDEALLFGC